MASGIMDGHDHMSQSQVPWLTGELPAVIVDQRDLLIRARPCPAFMCTLLVLCAVCLSGVACGRDGGVDHHMEMGKKLLAAGQLADALSHFHAAVGKRRARQTRFHPEAWLITVTASLSTSSFQMEIQRITWPTTAELPCFWQWGSPSQLCPT